MNRYNLDAHSFCCSTDKRNRHFCETNQKLFLFFLDNEFHILIYNPCMESGGHLDFKMDIIKQVLKKFKIKNWYEVTRQHLDEDLKNYRLRNIDLKKYSTQINYTYYDNAGKQYCITTDVDFMDSLINADIINESYKKTNEYLNKNGYNNYLDDLTELWQLNKYYNTGVEEKEIFKTIDHLVKKINQKTNNHANN